MIGKLEKVCCGKKVPAFTMTLVLKLRADWCPDTIYWGAHLQRGRQGCFYAYAVCIETPMSPLSPLPLIAGPLYPTQ